MLGWIWIVLEHLRNSGNIATGTSYYQKAIICLVAAQENVISNMQSSSTKYKINALSCVALLLGSLVSLDQPVFAQPADDADSYWTERDALDASFAESLENLAALCSKLDLAPQARTSRDWIIPRDPGRQYLFLPPESDPAQPAEDAPLIVRQWYNKFRQVRNEQAESLFRLARQQLGDGFPARSYQLLHEVLHEDPDHEEVRDILGYRQVNGHWRRPEGTIRIREMRTANRSLGLPAGGHWVVESGSFRLTTDHSPEAGRELVERLEELRDVWQQLFFCYHSNEAALERCFESGGRVSRSSKQHEVVLFRDRQEYVNRLQQIEPRIGVSVGYYLEARKTAYFYVDDDAKDDIYFHEVTHQLFSETGRVAPGVGGRGNYWIVEGVAMYMESLRKMGDYYTAGGFDADRLQYARYRALSEGFQVPLAQLVSLDRNALQQHEDIRRLYSQSAGMASMLMDERRGAYRRSLVDYLRAVYQGRDQLETLASLSGVSLPEFDRQYPAFLNVTDADLAASTASAPIRNLSLGRTAVTDAGLRHLTNVSQLQWLDIGYTQIGDAGLAHLKSAKQLEHLIAEHTQITDAALETIGAFPNLQILDLTGTSVSDRGLAQLKSLNSLRELWLGDTRITDAGLVYLEDMKELGTLDVGGTQVTMDGYARLKKALPSLNTEATSAP